jgi:CHAT domain-containing protein/Flp pilus assembly protein TadD
MSFDLAYLYHRRILCTLLLCLTIALPVNPLAAQTNQAGQAPTDRLYDEANRLFREGSRESLEQAVAKLLEAASIYHAAGDATHEMGALSNVGRTYLLLGEQQKAIDYFKQVLSLTRKIGDVRTEGVILSDLGAAYDVLGDKQQALDYFNQALAPLRAAGDRKNEATALDNIGMLYNGLDERQKALDYLNQAMALRRAIRDVNGMGMSLNNLGGVTKALGDEQRALDYYNQALPFLRAAGNIGGMAHTLNNIGGIHFDLGDNEKALAYYNQTLPVFHGLSNGRLGELTTLNNIGAAYSRMGQQQKALDYYNQALRLCRAINQRDGEAATLFNIAYLERERGNLTEALTNAEAAITILESQRGKISSQELRSAYFATVQSRHEFYIDLLMRLHKQQPAAGFAGKALQASERGRARSLLEMLAEANADIRQGVDPNLLARERALQQRLNATAQQQTQVMSGQHSEAKANSIAKEIDALTTEFQQVEAQIRQTSPRYAALTQPQPLTLKDIQTQVLAADTVLLEYSLGRDRSYLWAVTPTSITSYELPRRDEIETLARQVYALLTDPNQWSGNDVLADLRSGPTAEGEQKKTILPAPRTQTEKQQVQTASSPEAATRLSQMLLGPVEKQLGQKRIVVVADGALQYIPFGALPIITGPSSAANTGERTASNYQPVIVDHEIVSLPSASTLAVLRQEVKGRKPAEKAVAVLADPVFERDDERLSQRQGSSSNMQTRAVSSELPVGMKRSATESGMKGADLKIPRLPGTRQEANQILALAPASASKAAFDFSANRQTATSTDLSQYRYVHFATHGFLNSLHPELSGIVLSMLDEKGNAQDGFLRAHEVFNLKLPAELVVLSACQTGLGKEVRGEGLVGLTRGFMYAGASRVVVSLWSVPDEATAQLMAHFYRGMLKDNLHPAAALRAAQISLMKESRWQPPFYWAAFTLQGEWR